MEHYTISQLARAAGVPTSTLRYYERVGLVCPTGRADNNYRVYARDMLQRIHFIRVAQATGFSSLHLSSACKSQWWYHSNKERRPISYPRS